MTRLIDVPPGSLVHDGTRLALHLPDGRGYCTGSHPRALPDRDHLRWACDWLRGTDVHWHWREVALAPLNPDCEVLATGLTAEHFASAEDLEAALRARGVGHPAKVGDKDLRSADVPGCCVVREDGNGDIAHIHSDRSYTWATVGQKHTAQAGVFPSIDQYNTARWEIVALLVPDETPPEQVRALAGLPAVPAEQPSGPKVGDKGLRGADLPAGCVARDGGGSAVLVRENRAYLWIATDGHPCSMRGAKVKVDYYDEPEWEILALGVPTTATAQEARIAAGLEAAPAPAAAPPATVPDGLYVTGRGAVYVSEANLRTWLADHDGKPEDATRYEAGDPCPRDTRNVGPRPAAGGKPAADTLVVELRSRTEVDAALAAWPTTAAAAERFRAALKEHRTWVAGDRGSGALLGLIDGQPARVWDDLSGRAVSPDGKAVAYGLPEHPAPIARLVPLALTGGLYTAWDALFRMPIAADRTRAFLRGVRAFLRTGERKNFDTAVIAAARPAAQAPAWATRDAGALVVLPNGRVVLWSPKAAGGEPRWYAFPSVPYEAVPALAQADLPADAVNAEILLTGMDADEIAQVTTLRPATRQATRSVATMLLRLRGGKRVPLGWGILGDEDFTGVAHDGRFSWVSLPSNLSNLTLYGEEYWSAERRWRNVLADGLSKAQARAFAERLAGEWPNRDARRRFAEEAARQWHELGPGAMAASPPAGHEWAAAPAVVASVEEDAILVFGDEQTAPGTLIHYGPGFVWIRTVGGWAYLTAPAHGPRDALWGWPGDIELRDTTFAREGRKRPTEQARVIARDLSPEAQALVLLAAHRARHENKPLRPDTARAAAAGATARVTSATAEGLAALRVDLLREFASIPWLTGWEERARDLPRPAAHAFLHRETFGSMDEIGLTYRYVSARRDFLRFADWQGIPLQVAREGDDLPADIRARVLARAVEAALRMPALPPAEAAAAERRRWQRSPLRPIIHGVGPMLPLPSRKGADSARLSYVSNRIHKATLSTAGLDARAGCYVYDAKPTESGCVALPHGGLARVDAPTLLAVVGAQSEVELDLACQIVLPRLVREARQAKVRPGLVALGPETRGRVL